MGGKLLSGMFEVKWAWSGCAQFINFYVFLWWCEEEDGEIPLLGNWNWNWDVRNFLDPKIPLQIEDSWQIDQKSFSVKECHKIDPGHATLPALRKFQLFCENGGGIWRAVVAVIVVIQKRDVYRECSCGGGGNDKGRRWRIKCKRGQSQICRRKSQME